MLLGQKSPLFSLSGEDDDTDTLPQLRRNGSGGGVLGLGLGRERSLGGTEQLHLLHPRWGGQALDTSYFVLKIVQPGMSHLLSSFTQMENQV